MSDLTTKDFDVVLLHYMNTLWEEKSRVLSTGKGDVCFVPNVLDPNHLRTMQNYGIVATHGTECFTMHFFKGQITSCLLNVGRSKAIHVIAESVPYARCAGQMEHGISRDHRQAYGDFTSIKAVSFVKKHTHRGYPCDLEPAWFDASNCARGYKCEGHRDCIPVFVSYRKNVFKFM